MYLALAQTRFDGQENPVANIYGAKLYEVQKHLTITNHKYETSPLIINEEMWKRLPPDIQNILKEGAVKFAVESRKIGQETENTLLLSLQTKGMIINRPDIAQFRAATKTVYNEWTPVVGREMIDKIVVAAQ